MFTEIWTSLAAVDTMSLIYGMFILIAVVPALMFLFGVYVISLVMRESWPVVAAVAALFGAVPIRLVLDYYHIGNQFPSERGWWLIALCALSFVVGVVRWHRKFKAGEWE